MQFYLKCLFCCRNALQLLFQSTQHLSDITKPLGHNRSTVEYRLLQSLFLMELRFVIKFFRYLIRIFSPIKTALKCKFRTNATSDGCEEFTQTFDSETSRVESAWEIFVWVGQREISEDVKWTDPAHYGVIWQAFCENGNWPLGLFRLFLDTRRISPLLQGKGALCN
jgi:hypothetical protein